MSKLKAKYGKYFKFEGTTNGTDYFLRGLVGGFAFMIPFLILLGIGTYLVTAGSPVAGVILMILGAALLIPYMWFSLATTWKRINAFWPNHATKLTVAVFVLSFITQILSPESGIVSSYIPFLTIVIPQTIFSFYILFANSKVKKHIG